MPELLAGSTVSALDFCQTAFDAEAGSYTFTNTTYGVTTTGGTYVDCADSFVAPTTGRVEIAWNAQVDNSGADFTAVSFVVRAGATIGAGATILAADDARAIIMSNTDVMQMGRSHVLENLTPGDSYNVRLEHRVGANTGTAERRSVSVKSLP